MLMEGREHGSCDYTLVATEMLSGESLVLTRFTVDIGPCADQDCGFGTCAVNSSTGKPLPKCSCDPYHFGQHCGSNKWQVIWETPARVLNATLGVAFSTAVPKSVQFLGASSHARFDRKFQYRAEKDANGEGMQLTGLPDGLHMTRNGVLSGTPRESGSWTHAYAPTAYGVRGARLAV